MSDQSMGFTQGAVDLSGFAEAPADPVDSHGGSSGPTITVPLVRDVTETNLEEVIGLSQTVPVVLVIYSARSLSSQQAVKVVEDAARAYAGAFAVGKIDADTQMSLVSTLQVQKLPTAVALVAGRPVPVFEGVPDEHQFTSLMDELMDVAPQLGVVGRIAVTEGELDEPIPEAHLAPLAAGDREDWAESIQLWKKVLANNPADQEAALALRRAEFELRQARTGPESNVLTVADQLFGSGTEKEAFDVLLAEVAESKDPDAKEAARVRLVELFQLAVDVAAVKQARVRLAALLM